MPTTKKECLAGITSSLLDDTTTPHHGLLTLATAASAISPPDPWAINANHNIQPPCARRAAKSHMVQPAVVWKGMDGAATSYCCGKSIYGQGILTIDAQVEAPEHGKWWLD